MKKANYEFSFPLIIKFTADRDLSPDELYEMAKRKLDIAVKVGIFDVDENKGDLTRWYNILTPEEKARNERLKTMSDKEFLNSLR